MEQYKKDDFISPAKDFDASSHHSGSINLATTERANNVA